jgi:tetratricopeptide (TPR) repeat protein
LRDLLDTVFEKEKNPEKAVSVLEIHVDSIKNIRLKIDVLTRIACIKELLGELTGSKTDYDRAAAIAEGDERLGLLLESARIDTELGNDNEALDIIKEIIQSTDNDSIVNPAYELQARILFEALNYEGAISACKKVMKSASWDGTSPSLVSLYYSILTDSGKVDEAGRALAILKERYSSSPENIFISDEANVAGVSSYPTPDWILANGESVLPEKSDLQVDEPENKKTETAHEMFRYVQTGSFKMKENADYLAKEIGKKGFDPRIVEKKNDNELLYTVLVAPDPRTGNVLGLITKLRDSGFDGFVVLAME